MDKVKQLLASRKFWALVASLAVTAIMLATKQITGPVAEAAFVAALSTFKIATGIEGKPAAPQVGP